MDSNQAKWLEKEKELQAPQSRNNIWGAAKSSVFGFKRSKKQNTWLFLGKASETLADWSGYGKLMVSVNGKNVSVVNFF